MKNHVHAWVALAELLPTLLLLTLGCQQTSDPVTTSRVSTLDASVSTAEARSSEDEATGVPGHRQVPFVSSPRSRALQSLTASAPAPHPNQGNTSIPQVSFDPRPFLNQTTWRVNYGTGDNNNDGLTPATALATLGEVRRRWSGGILGVRPQLPSVADTVTVVGSPASSFSDPVAQLVDIDAQPGFSLLIDFVTTTKRSGTITTVPNAFARTGTGQQTVTDVGVADWTSDIDHPILDNTTGAFGWVVAGTSPATLSATRHEQSTLPADLANMIQNVGLTAASIVATNSYDILTLSPAYFGSQAQFRMAAGATDPGTTNGAIITIRHASLGSQGAQDQMVVNGTGSYATASLGAVVVFLECSTQQSRYTQGGTIFANNGSATTNGRDTINGSNGAACGMLCGYARRLCFHQGGGAFIDQDYQLYGSVDLDFAEGFASPSSPAYVGNFARFLMGAATSPMGFAFGDETVFFSPFFDAQGVVYGTTSASPLWKMGGLAAGSGSLGGGTLHVAGTATATFVTDGGSAAFFQAQSQNNAFGFNTGTGAWVGPTTMTLLHLDAALAAGTGLGSAAYWPPTGSRILLNL